MHSSSESFLEKETEQEEEEQKDTSGSVLPFNQQQHDNKKSKRIPLWESIKAWRLRTPLYTGKDKRQQRWWITTVNGNDESKSKSKCHFIISTILACRQQFCLANTCRKSKWNGHKAAQCGQQQPRQFQLPGSGFFAFTFTVSGLVCCRVESGLKAKLASQPVIQADDNRNATNIYDAWLCLAHIYLAKENVMRIGAMWWSPSSWWWQYTFLFNNKIENRSKHLKWISIHSLLNT